MFTFNELIKFYTIASFASAVLVLVVYLFIIRKMKKWTLYIFGRRFQ